MEFLALHLLRQIYFSLFTCPLHSSFISRYHVKFIPTISDTISERFWKIWFMHFSHPKQFSKYFRSFFFHSFQPVIALHNLPLFCPACHTSYPYNNWTTLMPLNYHLRHVLQSPTITAVWVVFKLYMGPFSFLHCAPLFRWASKPHALPQRLSRDKNVSFLGQFVSQCELGACFV